MDAMKMKHLQYSKYDFVGWTSSVVTYLENFKTGDTSPIYRSWDDFGKGDVNTSVIEYKLPNDAKVGLIADWGTGTDSSREMLIYILRNHDLDAIIHLGDIYYSGTLTQCQQNFYDIFAEAFAETGKPQIPTPHPNHHGSKVPVSFACARKMIAGSYWVWIPVSATTSRKTRY
jgi:hypothetical protein